jgi:peptidoglycan-associated lipoprotein
MRTTSLLGTLSILAILACGGTPKAEAPTPQQPTAAEIARQQREQDSLRTVAAADSVARAAEAAAELARQRVADSTEQARVAAQEAIRIAGERDRELRTELAVMVHFDTDATELQTDGRAALDRKIVILKANPDVRLLITGACDDRGSVAYNMALGERRASSVKRYLIAQGITDNRLEEATAGEGSPLEAGNDEAAWARNRRAEFVMVGSNAPLAIR